MNLSKTIYYFVICQFIFLGCTNETYIYDVNQVVIQNQTADKNSEKSILQHLNVLYVNLFEAPLSSNQLLNATDVVASIGDKKVAYETIVSKWLSDPGVILPAEDEMRNDIPGFIQQSYEKFYVRDASQAELTWWQSYLEVRPNISPRHIYYVIVTSDEYSFY